MADGHILLCMEELTKPLSVIYFWLGVTLTALAILITFLLRRKQKASAKLAFIVTMILFAFKSVESLYWVFVDIGEVKLVEYSYFAYYIVPLLLLIGHPRTRYTAGFYAFAIGVGYIAGMLMNPEGMLSTHKDAVFLYYAAYRGVIQHVILFFIGILCLFNVSKFKKRDAIPLAIILTLITGWMYLVKFGIVYPEGYSGESKGVFIADGSLATWIFGENIELWHRLVTMGAVLLIAALCIVGSIALNRLIFKRRYKKGYIPNEELPLNEDYGIIPFLARKNKTEKDCSI